MTTLSLISLAVSYRFSLLNSTFKNLAQILINLDKKAEELDEVLKDVRSEIHNTLWDLMELKKFAENRNSDKTNANS